MKKSRIAILIVFLVLIPLTLLLGVKLGWQSFYIISALILLELLVPFIMAFEGRKPQLRELIVIAILCGIAIIGRLVVPIPNFKPTYAFIILAGIAFGPETGYLVGALTAFISNFFAGQGPFTPWQMMAYGAGGMLAGFLFAKGRLPQKAVVMAIAGFLFCIIWIGPLLDCAQFFVFPSSLNIDALFKVLKSGFSVNVSQGLCTLIVLLILGVPFLEKLERARLKYGMLEN